ncbi:MAG: DUF2127 domain-containing protein [Gloeotrichia echinulata IR180]
MKKRPFGLIAIVYYKSFVAALLMVTSVAIFFALKNHHSLEDFSDNYVLEGKAQIINWLVEKILASNRKTLVFSSIASGIYAVVTAIEAVGLWYEKRWAHVLVLVLVGISIPPEVYELIRGISFLKLIVFVVNVGVFWYLFRNFPKHHH